VTSAESFSPRAEAVVLGEGEKRALLVTLRVRAFTKDTHHLGFFQIPRAPYGCDMSVVKTEGATFGWPKLLVCCVATRVLYARVQIKLLFSSGAAGPQLHRSTAPGWREPR
jgi:hypothetical protein